jgi:hypothetical protein
MLFLHALYSTAGEALLKLRGSHFSSNMVAIQQDQQGQQVGKTWLDVHELCVTISREGGELSILTF